MSAFARIKNPWGADDLTPTRLAQFSTNLAKAVNATKGGAWAPSARISIGVGQPQRLHSLTVVLGSDGKITTASGGRFELGDGDWPLGKTGHTGLVQRRVTSCLRARGMPFYTTRPRVELGGVQTNALSFFTFDGSTLPAEFLVPLEVMDGARIAAATFSFAVLTPRTALPFTTPRMRIVAIGSTGAVHPISTALLVGGVAIAAADADGYVSVPAPTSADAWYAKGAAQSVVIGIDPSHVVDLSTYTYLADVIDEAGPSTPSYPFGLWVSDSVDDVLTTNTSLTGSLTKRTLLTGQTNPVENGIYSGAWVRTYDLSTLAPFAQTHGQLIPIGPAGTAVYGYEEGSLFQILNASDFTVGTDPMTVAPEAIDPTASPAATQFNPVGNLWTSIALDFVLADFRYGQS